MKLHHTVEHTPIWERSESIKLNGLLPQVADVYKELVPESVRHLPVVWLAEGIWQSRELPVFEVDTQNLDASKLYHVTDDKLCWWVYQGNIPSRILGV